MSSTEMHRNPRLVIADDHVLMVEGLKMLLEPEFRCVEVVSDGHALLNAAAKWKPEIVLTDIGLPLLNGIEATRRLHKVSPLTKTIIVTAHSKPEYVVEAFRAGACGFVLKRCASAELRLAMRQVLNGYTYVTYLVTQHMVSAAMDPNPQRYKTDLTSRQRQVLQLVAEGYTAKEVANLLGFSVKTAVFHKTSIMQKLRLHTTAELTRYALEHGIIAGGPLPVALNVLTESQGDAENLSPQANWEPSTGINTALGD